MSEEKYGKCDVCRFCVHSEDDWACIVNNKLVHAKDSCPRYKPGSCENCSHVEINFGEGKCRLTGKDVFLFESCDKYDPSGRNSLGPQ